MNSKKDTKNSVYIATSLDGFIADKNGGIDFLDSIHIPEKTDMGYAGFMQQIDALLMGRNTFEKVLSFEVDWPYEKMIYVWSNSLNHLPKGLDNKVTIVQGDIRKVLDDIHKNDHKRLYVDGGKTIQSFLKEDLIDEITLTVFPTLLGDGIPLFSYVNQLLEFELVSSTVFVDQLVQNHYHRKRV